MFKRFSPVVLSLALALTACTSGGQTPAPTESVAPQQDPTAEATRTAAAGQSGCTVVSQEPTPDPTLEALLPLPDENDWIKGPDDAHVTIIEYGDFQ
jgi:hypothetical protein